MPPTPPHASGALPLQSVVLVLTSRVAVPLTRSPSSPTSATVPATERT